MKNSRTILFLCALLAILLLQSSPTTSQEIDDETDFDYNECGGIGPNDWGNLHEDWKLCKDGKQQSPIDVNNWNVHLNNSIESLTTGYYGTEAIIKNRGHDIMVKWPEGAGSLVIAGKQYVLQQCHWHSPSEHTFNGIRYPLELHMVHLSSDNEIAVIGIVYKTGPPDPFLTPELMQHISDLGQQDKVSVGLVRPPVIRNGSNYYRYPGSLTTPPCTEGVVWTLLQEVRSVSLEQLNLLRAAVHWADNARPIQLLNERIVSLYKPWHEEHASS